MGIKDIRGKRNGAGTYSFAKGELTENRPFCFGIRSTGEGIMDIEGLSSTDGGLGEISEVFVSGVIFRQAGSSEFSSCCFSFSHQGFKVGGKPGSRGTAESTGLQRSMGI